MNNFNGDINITGDLPHLPTPPRRKDSKRSPVSPIQPLSPTIIIDNSQNLKDRKSVRESLLNETNEICNDENRSFKLEGVAKDRRKMQSVVEKELEMIPLIRLDKPPSPVSAQTYFLSFLNYLFHNSAANNTLYMSSHQVFP